MAEVADKLERQFDLIGSTAIEDKLQELGLRLGMDVPAGAGA